MSQTGLRVSLHNALKPWQTGIDLHSSQTASMLPPNPKCTMTCMASLPTGRIAEWGKNFFFVLFCSYPESYNYKKKIKKREKSSGERRWLLTCLMVRFPSSIQPARAAHSALLSARQKSINFPTVEQVSLPPLSCRLFPPPALFILGRGEP